MAIELDPVGDVGFHQWEILASELKLYISPLDAAADPVEQYQTSFGDLVVNLVYDCRSTLARVQYDIEVLQDRHPNSSLIDGVMQFFFDQATGGDIKISMNYAKSIPMIYSKFHRPDAVEDLETLERVPQEEIHKSFNHPIVILRREAARKASKIEEKRYRKVDEDPVDDLTVMGLRGWNKISANTSMFLSSRDEQRVDNVRETAARLGELLKEAYDELRDMVIKIQWEVERAQSRLPNSVVTSGVLEYILNRAAGGFTHFRVEYFTALPLYFPKFSVLYRAQKSRPLF